MTRLVKNRWFAPALLLVFSVLIGGCGSGTTIIQNVPGPGGGTTTPGTISGSAVKGPFLAGSLVQAFRVTNGQRATLLASGTTDLSGNFSLTVNDTSYSGPVIVEVTGNYLDEATGQVMSTGPNPLRGAIASYAGGSAITTVRVTPLTHIAVSLASGRGGLTTAALQQAFIDVGIRFGVTAIDSSVPFNTASSALGADPNSLRYGLVNASISRLALTLNALPTSILTAAALDASDGTLDGTASGTTIAIPTLTGGAAVYNANTLSGALSQALVDFINSGRNGTGLPPTDPTVTSLQQVLSRVNRAPVAAIGLSSTSVTVNTAVALDGRQSADPDGDVLSYTWTVRLGATLIPVVNGNAAQASFTPSVTGTYDVSLQVRDTGGLTGNASAQVVVNPAVTPPPAALSIGTAAPIVLTSGQTGTVSFPLTNSGGRSANIQAVTLTFGTGQFTATARGTNPTSIAAGTTRIFLFDVTPRVNAVAGIFPIHVAVSARDSLSNADVGVSRLNAGSVSLLAPGTQVPLQIGLLTGTASLTQGQDAILSLPVTNPGTQAVRVTGASLQFNNVNILSSLTTDSPSTIAAGATALLRFATVVGVGTPAGIYTASASVQGRTAQTDQGVDATRSSVGTLTVIDVARLRVSNLTLSRSVVSRGMVVNASYTLSSIGGSAAQLLSVGLSVGSTVVSPVSPAVPSSLAPGQSITFNFQVPTSQIPAGTYSVNGAVDAIDSSTGQPVPVVPASPPPTLVVQSPAALTIAAFVPTPRTVAQGQTVPVTMTVRNGGTAASSPTTAALTFVQAGRDVTSFFTVSASQSNPVTVAGNTSVFYRFDVIASPGVSGAVQVLGTVTGRDVNSGFTLAPPAASLSWTVIRPAAAFLGRTIAPSTASQGQTFTVQQEVVNGGGSNLVAAGATFTMSPADGLSITPIVQPTSIPAGQTVTFVYSVFVAANAATGPREGRFTFGARDSLTNANISLDRFPALVVSLQTAANLQAQTMLAPSAASLGQSFLATVPVSNLGQAAASVTSASLFFSGTGITVTPITVPSTVPGLSTASFVFRVTVSLSAEQTVRSATFSLTGRDANSGSPQSISNAAVGSVTIQSPGRIAIADILQSATVSQGQSFVVTVSAKNTGQGTIILTTGTLTLTGDGVTITPRSNPNTIAGGQIATFEFDVTVASNATPGARTAGVTLTAVEQGTNQNVSTSRPDAGTITVQTPAAISLSGIGGQLRASLGATVQVTYTVTNTGQATARITAATLTFANSSGLTITPRTVPATVTGGATAQLVFDVAVASNAIPGNRSAAISVTGADANSGAALSASNATAGTLTIETAASLTVGPMQAPSTVSLGQTFRVTVPVTNTGQAAVQVTTSFLQFTGAGITVTPIAAPSTIPGLSTTEYVFSVAVALGAPTGSRSGSFSLFGIDSNSGNSVTQSGVFVGTVTVQAPGQLNIASISAPAAASQGQSFTVDVAVQNPGGATVSNLAGSLTFSGTGLTVTPSSSNPTAVAGGQSATLSYTVAVAAGATTGDRTASVTVSGTDSGTGAVLTASQPNAGTVTIETPAQLTVSNLGGQLTAAQGQTFTVTATVTNSGQADAVVSAATLSFSNSNGLTVTTRGVPVTIAGGASADVAFDVAVSSSAIPGFRSASVAVTATDANSSANVSASNVSAGTIAIQTPASLSVGTLQGPSQVSLGQTFLATVPVTNTGQSPATVTTSFLQFSGSGLTVAVVQAPASIPGLSTANYTFQVTVQLGSQLGARTASFSLFGFDSNSGTSISQQSVNVGTVTVQSPGRLALGSFTQPTSASRGQTFTVVIGVQNTGQNTVINTAPSLTFTGDGLTITASAGNPGSIAGGQIANYAFDVAVSPTATLSTRTAAFSISGNDAGTGEAVSASLNPAGTVTIQTPAALTVGALSGELVASLGDTFTVRSSITNTGQASARITAASLVFANSAGLTVVPRNVPLTVAGGTSADVIFDVAAASNTTPGQRAASVSVVANDVNSSADVSASNGSAGTVTLQTPASIATGTLLAPSSVSQGQTFLVTVPVNNTGQAAANVTTSFITVSGSGVTVVQVSAPTSVPGLSTANYVYRLTTDLAAATGSRSVSFTLFGSDANSAASLTINNQTVGSFTILTQGMLAISSLTQPSAASKGQTFTVQVGVQNTGQNAVNSVTTGLTYSGSGLTVTGRGTNPTSIAGGQVASFLYDVTVATTATSGARTASFTVSGVDAGTGGSVTVTQNNAGTVTVQTPASLALGSLGLPGNVSRGQVLRVTIPITNNGEASASVSAVSLAFTPNDNISVSQVSVPTTIAGGATANATFDVTIGAAAGLTTRTASVAVTATDANSGSSANVSTANAGSFTVQTAANVGTISMQLPSTASQGQTFRATAVISNSGQAAATITTVTLTFDNASGLIITPVAGNPSTIAGLSSASYQFDVAVSVTAAAGGRSAQLVVIATDANSGSDISQFRTGLGTVTIQTPATLVFNGGLVAPSTVSQGQTFLASYTVANGGQAAATVSAATLTFSGSGLTATARGTNPTSIAGQSTANFLFDVTVTTTATTGLRTASANVTATDSASGADKSVSSSNLGSVTVQTPAVLSVSTLNAPSAVSQGQTFVASFTVGNSGTATARVSNAALTFGSGLTVTAISSPTTIAGGVTATYSYSVSVAGNATPGAYSSNIVVTATDANSGSNVSVSRIGAGSVTVQTPAALSITAVTPPATINRAQTVNVGVTVQNTGSASARITGGTLTFSSGASSASFTPAAPFTLGGNSTQTLTFTITAGAAETLGNATVTANVSGTDANSGATLSAQGTGSTEIQKSAVLGVGDVTISAPAGIDRGGSTVNVTVSVTNGDANTADMVLTAGSLLFQISGINVTSEYTVTAPSDLLTRTIAGGTTENFVFTVAASSTATKFLQVFITGSVTGQDQNSSGTSTQSAVTSWFVRDAASQVFGQTGFTANSANQGGAAAAGTLNLPSGVATDGTRVAIADTANNRVLVYTPVSSTTPTVVLGQSSFTASGAATTQSGMSSPQGVAIGLGRLAVADTANHRVLIYNNVSSLTSGANADIVLGQADFTSGSANRGSSATDTTLSGPTDVAFSDGTTVDSLIVADKGNNRVLIYNLSGLVSGDAADFVLGQANFTTVTANRGGSTAQNSLSAPSSIVVTDTADRLIVADTGNNRVLIYNFYSLIADGTLGNGINASLVLGQANFTSGTADRGGASTVQNGLNTPQGVSIGGDKLFVNDSLNNRVVIYNSLSGISSNGASPNDLLGQATFTQSTLNNAVSGSVDAFSLALPQKGATIGSGIYFVADQLNSRVLRIPVP